MVPYNVKNKTIDCKPVFNFVSWLTTNGFGGKIVLTHSLITDDRESRIRQLRVLANVTIADSYNFTQHPHLFL
jgi:hypothetical protein